MNRNQQLYSTTLIIIFIITGLLFYAVQTDAKVNEFISSEMECDAAGAVVVSESISEAPSELTFQAEGIRDS